MRQIGNVAIGIAIMATCASATQAQKKEARQQAAAFSAVVECRTLTNDTARLACFDRTVAAIAAAERSGEIVVADKAQVREAKKELFGYAGLRIPFLGNDEDMPKEITATLTGARDLGYGKYEFTLDNGMRWRQTDDDQITPRAGMPVTVARGAMGSYMLRLRNRAVRVMRVR